jgi:hypothetical protein
MSAHADVLDKTAAVTTPHDAARRRRSARPPQPIPPRHYAPSKLILPFGNRTAGRAYEFAQRPRVPADVEGMKPNCASFHDGRERLAPISDEFPQPRCRAADVEGMKPNLALLVDRHARVTLALAVAASELAQPSGTAGDVEGMKRFCVPPTATRAAPSTQGGAR